MRLLKIFDKKRLSLISMFLFIYVLMNLLDGERGLISHFDKKNKLENLYKEKKILLKKLSIIEKENLLLTDVIDTDYLEILYRKKFTVGKSNEKVYIE